MKKNPFEILGITPEVVKKLDDAQLFKLVQSNYRLLQKVFHPDVVGSKSGVKHSHNLASQLNEAFEKLDIRRNGDSFIRFRQQYEDRLKRGYRKRIEDQQRQLNAIMKLKEELSSNSIQFLLHYLENWEKNGRSFVAEESYSIFSLKNITLGIYDVAVGYNLRYSALNLGKNYKEISFDEDRNMSYRQLCRSRFSPVKFIRLLGTVRAEKVDLVSLLDKKVTKASTLTGNRAPSPFSNGADMYDVLNTMDLDIFKENCMPHLNPTISENSYLFSFHLDKNKSTLDQPPSKVWVEGKIIKINCTS